MAERAYIPRLLRIYQEQVVPALMEEFGYRNRMAVPRLEKIVVSRGIGAATQDKKLLEQAIEELTLITGQKAVLTYAKKDISNFKLRRGMPIGARVTLRHFRMYEFLDRLINLALPRTKDFRGLSPKSFDGFGNYTLGIQEQIVFPEIDVDRIYKIAGMDITIVTTAKTDEEAFALLKGLGMPFKGHAQLV